MLLRPVDAGSGRERTVAWPTRFVTASFGTRHEDRLPPGAADAGGPDQPLALWAAFIDGLLTEKLAQTQGLAKMLLMNEAERASLEPHMQQAL